MTTIIRTASADQSLESRDVAGRFRYVQLLEVSVVIALCSYFYLKRRDRKQVRSLNRCHWYFDYVPRQLTDFWILARRRNRKAVQLQACSALRTVQVASGPGSTEAKL